MFIFYYYIKSRIACFFDKINSSIHANDPVQKGVIFFLINNFQVEVSSLKLNRTNLNNVRERKKYFIDKMHILTIKYIFF
jgi:hypothetical protein